MDLRPRLEPSGTALLAIHDPFKDLISIRDYEFAHDLGAGGPRPCAWK